MELEFRDYRSERLFRSRGCIFLRQWAENLLNAKVRLAKKKIKPLLKWALFQPWKILEWVMVMYAHTPPVLVVLPGKRTLVRGPAYDGIGMLSPAVPAPLLAPPSVTLLPSASKIRHFVMDGVCACLAMHGSAREADLVRGPACDSPPAPFEMGSLSSGHGSF